MSDTHLDDFNFYPDCIRKMIDKKFPDFKTFTNVIYDSIEQKDNYCIKTHMDLYNFIQNSDKICVLYSKNPEESYMHYIYNWLETDIQEYIRKCYESHITLSSFQTTDFINPLYIIMNDKDENVKFVEKIIFDKYFSEFFTDKNKIEYMKDELPHYIYFIEYNKCKIPIASRGRYFGIINKPMTFKIPINKDLYTSYPTSLNDRPSAFMCLYINKEGFKNDHEICLNINPYNSEEIIKNLCLIEDIKNV